MARIWIAVFGLSTMLGMFLSPVEISAEELLGSQVVDENEPCPDGMVVSGMSGGQGPVSKVCVRPNTTEMPSDEGEMAPGGEGSEGEEGDD